MIPRQTYIDKLNKLRDKQIIKVLTGVRRSGKSTILQLYQDELLKDGIQKDQIQVLNFEDLGLASVNDYLKLYQYINDRLVPNKMNYIFLDEIQDIPNFEKAVDSLFIKDNVDLYITGSNAFMLSGELATLLAGRYIEIPVYPFSFSEFINTVPDLSRQAAFLRYLDRGGFPFATELDDENTYLSYIQGIINTVLVKDILARMQRGNATLLEQIATFLTEASGNLITPAKIANTLTSNGIKSTNVTVISYLEKLVNSYLFYRCDRYDIAGKKYLQINSKYYAVDSSLRRALLGQKRPNMGSRLESIVYLELKRRGYEVYVGSLGNKEVDFVAIHDGLKEYYQVSLTVQDEKTYQREIAPFLEIKDNYPKILLTQDPGSYDDNGVKQINMIDWLLKS
ncbi:ATPase [Lactobacillus taiwanensis DSM 21401]|uniref:ATP-binding protein n=1 Tax=Lactobacillus taiwanensis TaxID=508451 RepID=UPI0006F07C1F|nr:ATP-binding protein [Lactobacillus taiwanensis]KRM97946.1 ATPase [Lactobacillus taiwanensis DSM 21401]OYS21745.1 ATPase [Lactobacillus taiwanensis]OYS23623.1 ATPase [Lactobacillus taiwanensis]OYS25503.1 ATPase [Lactobacillus taiwanensis]OYS25843.1 ATPase [Lactobacillus taiwanensis]